MIYKKLNILNTSAILQDNGFAAEVKDFDQHKTVSLNEF